MAGQARKPTEPEGLLALKGVGPALAEKLARLGIFESRDLLFHLPIRYEDRTRVWPVAALATGATGVIVARVLASSVVFGRRRSLLVRVADGSGQINLRFFHFNKAQQEGFAGAAWIRCFGEMRPGQGRREMIHPEYSLHREQPNGAAGQALTPVYPATEGVNQRLIRRLVAQALDRDLGSLDESLPPAGQGQWTLAAALEYLHAPPPEADLEALAAGRHPAQLRLAFEELVAFYLSMRRIRRRRERIRAPAMTAPAETVRIFLGGLGFTPTAAQQRVIAEVVADLGQPTPALRLVQGDVGSGKTVVAAAAAAWAVGAGYQAALMAPTDLLAEQHYRTLSAWFDRQGIEVGYVSGRLGERERRAELDRVRRGERAIVVGTHALFQDDVRFERLGLMVVDEQHRFGVDQRMALRSKGEKEGQVPHQLIMTATPIPRSLAMTLYADLDVSSIDELPPGRTPVETVVMSEARRDEVIERIHAAGRAGRQAYWVCPIIDESGVLGVEAATDTARFLGKRLTGLKVDLVHGRMKNADKERVMQAFRDGDVDVLVATTVIEVGVDVPNASVMIIENAERMGLAQLHQLRGRVGRGAVASTCVLMFKPPLSGTAKRRLGVLRETGDGFRIAAEDLEIRGPGEFLGTRQTGALRLKVADLYRHADLLADARQTAQQIEARRAGTADILIRRWISERERYGAV